MRVFNLMLQSLLMLTAMVIGVASLIDRGHLMWILLLQMIVGAEQYFVSCILKLQMCTDSRLINVHWYGATSLLLTLLLGSQMKYTFPTWLVTTFLFVVPWALAMLHWFIAYKYYQKRVRKAKFRFLNTV